MSELLDHFLAVGTIAVQEAGKEALTVQRSLNFDTLFKPDGSPATDGDKRSEQKIIEILSQAYPNHKLHGEEFGKHNTESGSKYLWVYDPIDGTWAYLNQETTACVNLALLENGEPIVGVVYNPFTGELFQATKGMTTTLNGQTLPLTKWNELKKGVFNYHLSREFRIQIEKIMKAWENEEIGKLVSQGGSPAYNLANVAKGSHTGFVMGFKSGRNPDPWDLSAGMLLVEQAGGQVTDLDGNRINPLTHNSYLVATTMESVHDQTLELMYKIGFGR